MTMQQRMAGLVALVLITGCSGSSDVANRPEQAILKARNNLTENKPHAVFYMLPPSYQADINAVVADTATRMDEEVWNKGVSILQQVVRILETKRDLILSTDAMASVPNPADVKANWDQAVGLMGTFASSDFTNLERLREGDVGALLKKSGTAIMRSATELMESSEQAADFNAELDKVRKMTATIVSQDGDMAVVKVDTEGEEPEEVEMVRIEGQWIPKDMADGFKEGIAEMRQNLETLDFTTEAGQQKKTMLLSQMAGVEAMLTQLEQAESKEQIEAVFGGLMMSMMGGGM